jgi:hypothetical protein
MFTIENVKFPATVTADTAYKVTGEIKLEGLLYVNPLPAWVVATVTYPTGLFSILNTAEQSATALAWFGKFSLNFGSGFNQQGDYKMDIKCYAGPTWEIIEGVQLAGVAIVIPPFPPIASYPTQQFNVSGSAPVPVVSVYFNNPIINPDNLFPSENTLITFNVVNQGTEPQPIKLHADITEVGAIGSGAIVGSQDWPLQTVQPNQTWNPTWNWAAVGAVGGKWIVLTAYDANGVLIPGTGPNNPWIIKQTFNILSSTPVVTNIGISIPSTAGLGKVITVTIPFDYQGPAKNLIAELVLGEGSLIPGVAFTAVETWDINISVTNCADATFQTAIFEITIPTTMTPKEYDSVTSIMDTNRNPLGTPYIDHGIITITSGGGGGGGNQEAYASYNNQTGMLSYAFSGFASNDIVTITAGGNVNFQTTADSNGNGSGNVVDEDGLGNYVMTVSDSAGITATADFTI